MIFDRENVALLLPRMAPPLAARLAARAGLDHSALTDPTVPFDVAHYSAEAKRRFVGAQAALFHYWMIGEGRGIAPHPDFDPQSYCRFNPDVTYQGYKPYAHYLNFGRHEGRRIQREPMDEQLACPDFNALLQQPVPAGTPLVNVVIPVHGNRKLSLRTIASVLASRPKTPYELVVIDDDSPDPVLKAELAQLAAKGFLKLLTNDRNRGFVASANRGLEVGADRDVVLLNSDTYVHDDWLDRLLSGLHSRKTIATASPISNTATILSYPIFLQDNDWPTPSDSAMVDDICRLLAKAPVEIPTALGFCMAIDRICLKQIGYFDEGNFGRGYGEENDFSMRAARAGWCHVAVPNVFVWHRGGGSFGDERDIRIQAALKKLEELHPGYGSAVHEFIARDPLRELRRALDIARLRLEAKPKVMQLHQPVRDDSKVVPLVLRADVPPFVGAYRVTAHAQAPLPNLPRICGRSTIHELAQLMQELDVAEARIRAGDRLRFRAAVVLELAAKRAGVRLSHMHY